MFTWVLIFVEQNLTIRVNCAKKDPCLYCQNRVCVCARAYACIQFVPLPSWYRLYMGYASFMINSSKSCLLQRSTPRKMKENKTNVMTDGPLLLKNYLLQKMSTPKNETHNYKKNWLGASWAATATRVDRTVFTIHLSQGVPQGAPRYCVEFAVINHPPF